MFGPSPATCHNRLISVILFSFSLTNIDISSSMLESFVMMVCSVLVGMIEFAGNMFLGEIKGFSAVGCSSLPIVFSV